MRQVCEERRRLRGNKIRIWGGCLMLFCLLIGGGDLGAQEKDIAAGPVHIEADSIAYEADQDTFHAQGKVLITFPGGFLRADAAHLNRITNRALAEGHVYVDSDGDILEGERVDFDIVAKTGTVSDGKMFIARNHFYITGQKIEKTGVATYQLEDATVTACDGETPDWRFASSELDVTVDGYGVMKHGRFLVRDVPVLYAPYLLFPAKTTRQSGLLFPRLSYSRDKNGLDVELPFYWAISDNADATFYQRYMSERGFKEGVELRYALGADSFGTLYGDFLNDRKQVTETVGGISRNWQDDRRRWSYYLNHETTFSPGFTLRSDLRKVSDPWYFRDFSAFNYYLDNYSTTGEDRYRRVPFLANETLGSLDSTVRLTKDWSLYNLTALVRYTDDFSSNSNDATLQKYPEVTITGFRQPVLGERLQMDFTGGYTHWYRGEGQKGHIGEISPTFYLPMKLGPYLQLTPQAGFQGDLWERSDSLADSGDKRGDRKIFRFGSTASTEISRVFEVGGKRVEKIRHAIKPEFAYTYIPETTQDRIPNFLAQIPAQHGLTYGVTQTLLARMKDAQGKVSYQEMMRFKVSQTYDIREARRDVAASGKETRPFGDVSLELDLVPYPFLSFAARNIYNVNSGGWKQNNYDLTLSDPRGDTLTAGYRYTRDTLEEINVALKAVLTPSVDFIYMLKRNQLANKIVEATYSVKYRKQCWDIELVWSDKDNGANGTDARDQTIMLYVSLSGFRTDGFR
ncbi:MAG: LPS assembly protein LptD [Deltaproteobacteria bacterium]|nr:LPS assembly protein LptD [Deltaproteobacteria bacterium]